MIVPSELPSLIERELVLTRVIAAPRARVYALWTDPAHLDQWFGPRGFVTTTRSFEFAVGGRWCFDMRAPDGTLYTNRAQFLEIVPEVRLVYEHGSDVDDDPARFLVHILFDEQRDGKTVITLRQLHPNKAQRDAGLAFGAVELGLTTLDKLAALATA